MDFAIGDPSQITPSTGNSGAALTVATAVFVLLLAGAGYFGLSNRSNSTEVATDDTVEQDIDKDNSDVDDKNPTNDDDAPATSPINSVVISDISEGAPSSFGPGVHADADG